MISDFLVLTLILVGIGGVLAVIFRKTKSLDDKEAEAILAETRVFKAWRKVKEEKIKPALESRRLEDGFSLYLEKSLRLFTVFLLKLENKMYQKIQDLKQLRIRPEVDSDYWLSLRRKALEKRIDQAFHGLRKHYHKDLFDPVHEEMELIKESYQDRERWLNLARFYLAKDNISEASRVLINYWQVNKGDEKATLLFENLYIRAREKAEAREAVAQVKNNR